MMKAGNLFAMLPLAALLFSVLPLHAAQNPCTPPNFPLPAFPDKTFNVRDFGATGGGSVNDTAAIDRAIDKCNAAGGGTVTFPAGRYGAGSIQLKSNVRLQLDPDAVIFGIPGAFDKPEENRLDAYQDFGHSHFRDALLYGEDVENIAIVGGKIDGGGAIGHGDPKAGNGDKLISIRVGKNLDFENITHEKGGHFCYLLNDCTNVTISGIVIKESRDGVDLMGCSDVQIHGCRFTGCGDDTVGVKSDYALGKRINSANIYVWDSYFESGCNGLQFGSETAGDFSNCNFWNIGIGKAGKAGIGITSCDSAVIDGVNYRNFDIKGASCPIYILTWDRLRTGDPDKKVGAIRNIHSQDVTFTACPRKGAELQTSVISGWATSPFENITLENVKITYEGGDTNTRADLLPPNPKDYSPARFGARPASAFYVRNGKGLTFKNVEVGFENSDARTPLVIDNVDGLTLHDFKTQKSAGGQTLRLAKVSAFSVRNCDDLKPRESVTVEKGEE
jgi:polygalacturonase